MRGIRYCDLDKLENALAERVKVVKRSCLATGLDDLPKRWQSVIDHNGYYFKRNVVR